MACRLVEAAPTWQQDRGQGARILLLAMGDGRIEAPDDRIVAWTWQLARAARDHEYRYAGSHVNDGRSLLGALAAASSDAALTEAAARLATIATSGPLEAGAAILAVASPRRGTMAERLVERARMTLSADPPRLAAALGSNIPAPAARVKTQKRAKAKEKERADTISFNGAVVGSTPPAVAVARKDGTVTVPVSAEVAVRLRDDADDLVRPQVGDAESLRWTLTGDGDAVFESAVDVRRAAADAAPLEVQVAKLLGGDALPDRTVRVSVEGAGLVVPLGRDEGEALLDDAARRVLSQLKNAGVRGRVRVEFELEGADGETVRDSRPGAVRKIARGEPVGGSPERRDRRRRSRSRGRRKPDGDAEAAVADVAAAAADAEG